MQGQSDEIIAARLRQFFSTAVADCDVINLRRTLKVNFRDIKRVVRGLPTEFGLYNSGRTQYVKYYAAAGAQQDQPNGASNSGGNHACSICNLQFASEEALQGHLGGARHKVNLLAQQLKSSGSFKANLQGLQVSDFPEGRDLKINECRVLQLLVENVGNVTHTIKAAFQVRTLPDVRVLTDFGGDGTPLPPGAQLNLEVEVTPCNHGIICTLVMLDFGFVIARELRVECDPFSGDSSIPDISATAPYQKRKGRNLLHVHPPTFVPGEKEKRPKMAWLRPPRQHNVPIRLRQLVANMDKSVLQAEVDKIKQAPAGLKQHLDKLHMLLHLEELQQEVDVRTYDMTGVTMEPSPSRTLLWLEVPGLAEARPSVLRGDSLYVARADGVLGNKEWQGYVHMVERDKVALRFHKQLHTLANRIAGLKFNVRFTIKRTGFVFMHEALDAAQGGTMAGLRQELLLPPPDARSVPGTYVQIPSWRNSNVGSNPEQAEAVRCVVSGTSGKLPFIIWGPPGTGKTSTLVEAAAQVLRLLPNSRLLLAAPSNLAADLLALRLLQSGRPKSEMLRVCAYSRPKEDLMPGLEDVTTYDDRTQFAFLLPTLQQLTDSRIRVVVVTALMAAKLHALGVPAGHFTHIMLDEAGHAEEPLALCALAGIAGPSTQVVLAGDPKQLGPVIHSGIAKESGLGLSLLERLANTQPYAALVDGSTSGSHSSTQGLIVKLVRNYRSHSELLHLPSELFYQGELQACASPEITHTLLHWDKLPNNKFPMLFHSIVGEDEREANSPSWFNALEAKQVLLYIRDLMSLRRNRLTANQIGVVTPYRKQVQKIKALLRKDFPSVQVGSVEQLQGQEKRVIIISTVRSTPQYLEHDFTHKLGFVGNAKRFNVAVTRAQALLIVIGNPSVLMHDKHWLALLMKCKANDACVGQPMPDLTEAAAAAGAAAGAGASNGHAPGQPGSSTGRNGASNSLQQEIAQLEKLMACVALSKAEEDVAAQQQLLEAMFGISAFTDEVGGATVRHEM